MANIDLSAQQAIAGQTSVSIPPAITIIGTGGFGSWVAVFAAKSGVSEIVLVNHSGTNEGRSRDVQGREIAIGPFEDHHMGVAKVDALEEIILRSNPNVNVIKKKITFNPNSDFDLVKGIVFNGVSNQETHLAIWDGCSRREIPCFSGVYNGVYFGSVIESPVGMSIGGDLPVWVGSAALCGALAFHSACVKPLAYYGDGSDFCMSRMDMAKLMRGSGSDL